MAFDKDMYLDAAKYERQLLKKRRNAFSQELQAFGFHRMMNLRKRQRREPDEGQEPEPQLGLQGGSVDGGKQQSPESQQNGIPFE